MRPDDITIQEIAKKHAHPIWWDSGRMTGDQAIALVEAAITEALDHLDEADLASQLARAENDRDGYANRLAVANRELNAAKAEITDLRFAAQGMAAILSTSGAPTATHPE